MLAPIIGAPSPRSSHVLAWTTFPARCWPGSAALLADGGAAAGAEEPRPPGRACLRGPILEPGAVRFGGPEPAVDQPAAGGPLIPPRPPWAYISVSSDIYQDFFGRSETCCSPFLRPPTPGSLCRGPSRRSRSTGGAAPPHHHRRLGLASRPAEAGRSSSPPACGAPRPSSPSVHSYSFGSQPDPAGYSTNTLLRPSSDSDTGPRLGAQSDSRETRRWGRWAWSGGAAPPGLRHRGLGHHRRGNAGALALGLGGAGAARSSTPAAAGHKGGPPSALSCEGSCEHDRVAAESVVTSPKRSPAATACGSSADPVSLT